MALATLTYVKEVLKISGSGEDTELQHWLDAASAYIANYCDTLLESATITDERVDGGVKELFTINSLTATSITTIKDGLNSDSVVLAADYALDPNTGGIFIEDDATDPELTQHSWGKGRGRWKVTYVAGYVTIPLDLQLATARLVALYRDRPMPGTKSEQIGNYSVSFQDFFMTNGLPDDIAALLEPYRNRKVI